MKIDNVINENYLLESQNLLFLPQKSYYTAHISIMYDVEREIELSLVMLNNILNRVEKSKN